MFVNKIQGQSTQQYLREKQNRQYGINICFITSTLTLNHHQAYDNSSICS
jgi:hypothetical protein